MLFKDDLIKVQQLSYSYNKTNPVLDGVSFVLRPGNITGLLGINGSGKSTLIGLLTGQLKNQAGTLEVLGKSYLNNRNGILRQIALVPQNYAFYPNLSVKENLLFFAKLRADLTDIRVRLNNALNFCQLESSQHTKAKDLSGGLKRRLNLSIGIINNPKLLFLDEPTVGIDAISRGLIIKAIKQLQEKGVSVVYTSHYMREIEALCNEVLVLNKGKIVYNDTLENFSKKQSYYFNAILKYKNTEVLQEFSQHYRLTIQGNRIFGQLSPAINIHEFNQDLLSQNLSLCEYSLKPMSLESLFVEMVS